MPELMDKLKESILDYAKKEAERIVKEAERTAKEIIESAEREWRQKCEGEINKIIEDAKRKAEEILVEAKIKARMNIAQAKDKVIKEILSKVRESIERGEFNRTLSLKNLLKESLKAVEGIKVRVYVNPKDVDIVKEIVEKEYKDIVKEIVSNNKISGGIIVESLDKSITIDNTYNTRIKALERRLLQIIARELFK